MRHGLPSTIALFLVAGALPCLSQTPFEFQSGTAYGFRVDPRGGDGFGDPGWGIGGEGAWNFKPLPRPFTLKIGAESGNLESDDRTVLAPGGSESNFINTSHDYFRIFGGIDVGVHGRARVQPHAAVHLALARQDVKVSRFDRTFGEFDRLDTDSDSGLGYDATIGLAFRATRRLRIDAGARYMRLPRVSIDETFGGSTRPEFALIYVGFGYGAE